jgi:hypothetical protein
MTESALTYLSTDATAGLWSFHYLCEALRIVAWQYVPPSRDHRRRYGIRPIASAWPNALSDFGRSNSVERHPYLQTIQTICERPRAASVPSRAVVLNGSTNINKVNV